MTLTKCIAFAYIVNRCRSSRALHTIAAFCRIVVHANHSIECHLMAAMNAKTFHLHVYLRMRRNAQENPSRKGNRKFVCAQMHFVNESLTANINRTLLMSLIQFGVRFFPPVAAHLFLFCVLFLMYARAVRLRQRISSRTLFIFSLFFPVSFELRIHVHLMPLADLLELIIAEVCRFFVRPAKFCMRFYPFSMD